MARSEFPLPPVKISAELPPGWFSALSDQAIPVFTQAVESYAEGMVEDLRLGTVQFEWKRAGQSSRCSIIINGQKCRLPFRCVNELLSVADPNRTARFFSRIIHENRKLLVSAEIASALREDRSLRTHRLFLPELSRVSFHEYLSLLVQGCFHVLRSKELISRLSDRASAFDDEKTPLPKTPQEYYEFTVGSLANLRCILYRSPGPDESVQLPEPSLIDRLDEMRENYFFDLGIRLPIVQLREDARLGEQEFRSQINDLRLPAERGLGKSEFLVDGDPRFLKALGLAGQSAQNPATGARAIVLSDLGAASEATGKGLTVMDRERYLVEACDREMRHHAGFFVVTEGLEHELDLLRPFYPHIVSATETRFGRPVLAQILRNLAAEGVSIRDLPSVLEAMVSIRNTKHFDERGKKKAIETVRFRLKDHIAYRAARGYKTLSVYQIDEDLEETLLEWAGEGFTDEQRLSIGKAVWESICRATISPLVIVTTSSVRRILKDLIEIESPEVVVLSDEEISGMQIQSLGHISQRRAEESRIS